MNRYLVPKGEHYSASKLGRGLRAIAGLTFAGRIAACFTIDESFVSDPTGDISKIFGLSDELDHHCCSARFGLVRKPGESTVGIYAYTYLEGKRRDELLCLGRVGDTFELELIRLEESWFFSAQRTDDFVWDPETQLVQAKPGRPWVQFTLYPYYGGNDPARQDTYFPLRWL